MRARPLPQQRDETFFRHRLAEQEALAEIAAHAHQRHRIRRFLDAHGHGDAAGIVGEIDRGLAQRRVGTVGAAVGDDRARELDLGKGQFGELRKGRLTAAETFNGEPQR